MNCVTYGFKQWLQSGSSRRRLGQTINSLDKVWAQRGHAVSLIFRERNCQSVHLLHAARNHIDGRFQASINVARIVS